LASASVASVTSCSLESFPQRPPFRDLATVDIGAKGRELRPLPEYRARVKERDGTLKQRVPGPRSAQGLCRLVSAKLRYALAGAAAAGRVVEADVAAAALLEAAMQRRAARLQDRAASLVAAGAGDAAAVRRVFTLAHAAGEVALAYGQAVERAAAGAQAAGQCLAQVLQRGTGHVVFAVAVNLESTAALFDLHRAAGNDAPSRCRGTGRETCRRGCDGGSASRTKEQPPL
jgi:hypothetical protein